MKRDVLSLLRCPYCRGEFTIDISPGGTDIQYDVLQCNCGQFPVVAGIPILQKERRSELAVALIRGGKNLDALLSTISPDPRALSGWWRLSRLLPHPLGNRVRALGRKMLLEKWQRRAVNLLVERALESTMFDLLSFYFPSPEFYNYFAYRFGQPRHLVALSFVDIITDVGRPVLDLSCGCGNITRSIVGRAANRPVIGVDTFFFGLYVAKHWVAPEAEYVCCSAEDTLPFDDGAFSVAYCSDAFQYIQRKAGAIRELRRVIEEEGIVMVVWARNALIRRPFDGMPLTPTGYADLIAGLPSRMVADQEVLARYMRRQGPPLHRNSYKDILERSPTLSIVISKREDVFRDYDVFDTWPHGRGALGINPLYLKEDGGSKGVPRLIRTFPSAYFEEEHAECLAYLPESVEVQAAALEDVVQGRTSARVEELIGKYVLLGMPARYYRDPLTLRQLPISQHGRG